MMGTMSEQETSMRIPGDDHVALELRLAVHGGDVEVIQGLLRNDPALASARLVGVETVCRSCGGDMEEGWGSGEDHRSARRARG